MDIVQENMKQLAIIEERYKQVLDAFRKAVKTMEADRLDYNIEIYRNTMTEAREAGDPTPYYVWAVLRIMLVEHEERFPELCGCEDCEARMAAAR